MSGNFYSVNGKGTTAKKQHKIEQSCYFARSCSLPARAAVLKDIREILKTIREWRAADP
jgi:hypothetical protein